MTEVKLVRSHHTLRRLQHWQYKPLLEILQLEQYEVPPVRLPPKPPPLPPPPDTPTIRRRPEGVAPIIRPPTGAGAGAAAEADGQKRAR